MHRTAGMPHDSFHRLLTPFAVDVLRAPGFVRNGYGSGIAINSGHLGGTAINSGHLDGIATAARGDDDEP